MGSRISGRENLADGTIHGSPPQRINAHGNLVSTGNGPEISLRYRGFEAKMERIFHFQQRLTG
jgi:hypothetical protein